MARTRQNKKYRRGKTRHQTKRGGGGCFGGLCKPNKASNMKVETPGVPPKNNTTMYSNPLRAAQKALNNAQAVNAQAAASVANLNDLNAILNRNLTAEEISEMNAMVAEAEAEAGTGLGPGSEVNVNTANLNRITSILSRPLAGMPTNEEVLAELEALGKKKRKTRRNHRGGGGCFGGICGPNKKMIEQVAQPGTAPVTMVENPIQTKSRMERAQELYAKSIEKIAKLDETIQKLVVEKAGYQSMISGAKNQNTKNKIIAAINTIDGQINQANLAKTKIEINLMALGSLPKGALKNRRR